MFYNSNLLTILNLLLIGEKPPEKKADKKLAQMFDLQGTNLFLIPCEPRNESFSDMFKRLLSKYSMISVALYRKNEQEDFYYVYTNPKKTTLIRETDMVFVLSSTENIIAIYEKNLIDVNMKQKMFDGFYGDEKNENDIINDNDNKQPFINALQDAVQNQLKESGNNKKKDKNVDNINLKNALFQNLFKDRKSTFKKGEDKDIFIQKGKYTEIDNMQNKLDKAMEKLKSINLESKNIEKEVNNFVQEEISNQLSVYITKTVKKN